MKRFFTFLIAAAALASGWGCSDSGTDEVLTSEAPTPVIALSEANADSPLLVLAEGGAVQIKYRIDNPVKEGVVAVTSSEKWVHSFDCAQPGVIAFTCDPNEDETRLAILTLTYEGAQEAKAAVLQSKPEVKPLTFDIQVSDITSDSAVVTWTPSNNDESYLAMVVKTSIFDSCETDEEYIASDLAYIQEQADAAQVSLSTMLSYLLTTGPIEAADGKIGGLTYDTDYYAYAYGMTAEGVATSAITKTQFRTAPFSCEFTFAHTETDSSCDVEVTPTNTGCFYYFDLVEKADFDTWGSDAEIIAETVDFLKETVDYYHANGYTDLTLADLFSIGPDGYQFEGLSPDTDYVVYAFALTEEGEPLTGVTRETVHTQPFIPTDDCTFDIGFANVTTSAFDVLVHPSSAATRYYIGVCPKELFDSMGPAAIADKFIAMENRYEIDWAGNNYIWTGDTTANTYSDLSMGDLDAATEYAAVVFGVSTEGKRTTEVAYKFQTTAELAASSMTIDIKVRNITATGAIFDVTPSNPDEVYFVDALSNDEYANYKDGKEAYVNEYVEILKQYGFFEYSLFKGNQAVDYANMLYPSTTYVVVAFGYNGGRTTPIFESELFTTPAEASGAAVNTARSRRLAACSTGTPRQRKLLKQGAAPAASSLSPRGILARFSTAAALRELPARAAHRTEASAAAQQRLRRH